MSKDKGEMPEDDGVLKMERKEQDKSEKKMLTLFKIDDTEYKVPAKPKPIVALRYLDDIRKRGEDVAASNLLYSLLGEESWNALLGYEDLEFEQLEYIMKSVQELVAGSMQGQSGKGFTVGRES